MPPPRTVELTALTTSIAYEVTTRWEYTLRASRVRAVLALADITTNFEAALAIQTATTDSYVPNTPVVLGAWVNATTRVLRDIDVTAAGSGDVNNAMFFRLIVAYRIKAGGGTFERGSVTLLPSWRA